MIRRIHIVGGPGSGKTTLAHQVAEALQIHCYELDAVGYEGGAGASRPLELRLADVRRIAAEPAWVTEGIYLDWAAALFETADQIVWLDLPWRVAAWRIVLRHIRAELRGNNPHHGWLKLIHFLGWCRGYYKNSANPRGSLPNDDADETRANTETYLNRFHEKLVRCENSASVKQFLSTLKAGSAV